MGRVLILLACLALVWGLPACGGGGDEQGGEGTAAAGPVEITYWHTELASNLDTLQTLVRRYDDSQSEVKVKLAFQGS